MTDTSYTWTHGRGGRFSDPINIEFRADLSQVQNAFGTISWHIINVPMIHDQRLIDGKVGDTPQTVPARVMTSPLQYFSGQAESIPKVAALAFSLLPSLLQLSQFPCLHCKVAGRS